VSPRRVLFASFPVVFCACGSGASSGAGSSGPDGSATLDASGGDSGSTSGADGSATPDASGGDGGSISGPGGCQPIAVDSTTKVDNSGADTYAWFDAQCHPRTAALLRNDAVDGLGGAGGYLRKLTYEFAGQRRSCTGTGANGWNGFGYPVNHYGNTVANTQQTQGQYAVVFAGRHHAIHQFKWRLNPGGPVDVTAQWIFATGRDHPLFSVTYDASPAGANVVFADTRTPYGDLGWDNDAKGPVSGVGWGDKYRFQTTGSGPVTPTSAWDYTQPNTVPYDVAWSTAADAEMGLVATRSWQTKIEGGDYGGGLLTQHWGKTGMNLLMDIPDWEWPYQLNQYELPFVTTSHRLAWGATYGAVGKSSYTAFGATLVGFPFQSYAVYVVLGSHGAGAVAAQVREIETTQGATLTASRGTVSAQGPAGVARADAIPYTPAGFDPNYAAWDAHAASGAATLVLSVSSGSLANPVFHLHDYGAGPPSSVTLDGKPLTADSEYFASVDPATSSLWITLNLTVTGTATVAIDP
jgi:hypothetical protein